MMPCRGSTSRHSAITRSSPWPSSVPLPDAAEDRSQLPQTDLGPLSVHRILSPLCSKRVGDPVQVRAALLSPQEPCQELASQVDVPTFRDGVARQPRSHPLELRLAYPQEVRRLLRVHDLPAAGECPCDLLEDRGLQEGVQAGVLVAPHALQPSLSGPAVPDFLGDFLEQAAETVGEPLFGASNGPTGAPYSRHVPVRPG
jgi:hypothetical protein